jgi:hypothetical protein
MAVTLLVKQVSLEEHAVLHRRVKSFHGETGQMQWEHSREQVIEHIANQLFHYYFHKDGRAVRIVVDRMANGELFVKAETDNETPGTLLELPPFNRKPSQNFLAP